jgi:chloride channel protein, CIC family
MGAAVGSVAHLLMPGYTAGPGAYALVGMGTAFAGIIRAPLTSVIMIFELTRDYSIIVPLMVSNLIAFFISHRLQPQTIYHALSRMDGIHLPDREVAPGSQRLQVSMAMRPAPRPFALETTVGEALVRVRENPLSSWPVSDGNGFAAMIGEADLEQTAAEGRGDEKIGTLLKRRASGQSRRPAAEPHVHPDHTLAVALERLGSLHVDALPVVSRANVRELLGVITLRDILTSFGVAGSDGEGSPRDRA